MIPPGEIVQAIQGLVVRARGGLISADEFRATAERGLAQTDRYFQQVQGQILLDPKGPPRLFQDEVRGYRQQRAGQIGGIRTLLDLGVRELIRFFDDREESHLTDGLYLVQRAEQDLAALQAELAEQSAWPLSCLSIGGDLFGDLAEQLVSGSLSREDFQELVHDYVLETLDLLRMGQDHFLEAANCLHGFDGSDFASLLAAADSLQSAVQKWLAAAANCQESVPQEAIAP